MKSTPTWRVFCAIDLPQPIRERLRQHIERLRGAVPHAKASWSRETNIHLTVKFLGDIPTTAAETLSHAASRAVAGISVSRIVIQQTGVFPKHGPPRILWIGVDDPSGGLQKLHQRLEKECSSAGFSRSEQLFHPHLTIARLRGIEGARTLAAIHQQLEFAAIEAQVSELLVFRSELSAQGSKYTVLSRHPLG
jgi:RNA 2',3'-cyclic 3'-phosphodiesterase